MSEQEQLRSLEDAFMSFLVEKANYPKDSLVRECPMAFSKATTYYLDLAVVNPKTSRILSIFEFKSRIDENTKSIIAATFRQLIENFDSAIPAFLVTPSQSQRFEIYHLDESDSWQPIKPESLPTFEALSSAERAKAKLQNQKKTKKTLDRFGIICYSLAFILGALLVSSFIARERMKITAEQLILIGIVCALAVVPHAAKLKFLGIEFERINSDRHSKLVENDAAPNNSFNRSAS